MTAALGAGTGPSSPLPDVGAGRADIERVWRLRTFRVGAALLAVIAVCSLAPGWVVAMEPGAPSPTACSLRADDGTYRDRLAPGRDHWFGTDEQGCDIFSRVVHGARNSMVIGLGAGLLTMLIGTVLGVIAGWSDGALDSIVRRVGDVVLGIPFVVALILILSVVVAGPRSPTHIVLAFSVLLWPTAARISRGATRTIMTQSYVEASRSLGASNLRIAARHVIPNAMPVLITFTAPLIGLLIATEATLSYLGVGMTSPAVSWGLMIDRAQPHYASSPHMLIFPCLFLAAAVAGFMLIGDALIEVTGPDRESR